MPVSLPALPACIKVYRCLDSLQGGIFRLDLAKSLTPLVGGVKISLGLDNLKTGPKFD